MWLNILQTLPFLGSCQLPPSSLISTILAMTPLNSGECFRAIFALLFVRELMREIYDINLIVQCS